MKAMIWLLLTFAASAPIQAIAADQCGALKARFDGAIAAKQAAAIESAFNEIDGDVECGFKIDDFRAPAVAAEIDALSDPAQSASHAAALKFAIDKLSIAGRWNLDEKLGDYYYKTGDRAVAKRWYENALSLAMGLPAEQVSDEEKSKLTLLASGSWILASNDNEGQTAGMVIKSRAADGSVGGVFGLLDRGAKARPAPIPVNFVYAKTDFTPVGQAAADDLAQAMHEHGVTSLLLIGHADPRGDKKLNLILSRQRAERLRAYLLAELAKKGDAADIRTEGVGDQEPFDVSVLPAPPTKEEAYALDRRVEFARGPD